MSRKSRTIEQRTEAALQTFLEMIRTGRFPEQMAKVPLLGADIPSAKWSAGNQLIMMMNSTNDARGFRQWQQAGRQVSKGAKAFHIFAPRTVTRAEKDERTGDEQKRTIIVGWTTVPVFRYEDTEGEPLPTLDPPVLPPLAAVASKWGIQVSYAPAFEGFDGYYQPGAERIVLCTHDERVFFHELAHAAHFRIMGRSGGRDGDEGKREPLDPRYLEIVAETAAASLAIMYGIEGYEVESMEYIEAFAGSNGDRDVTLNQIMRYARDVKNVIELIIRTAEAETKVDAA